MMKTLTALIFGLMLMSSHIAIAQISGTVYRDFNSNGQKGLYEVGVANVIVTGIDQSGNINTASTDAMGEYTLNISGCTGEVRVTFDLQVFNDNGNQYDDIYPSFSGSGNGTSTTFVSCGTSEVNLGVNTPTDYCQEIPDVVVPCYINGDGMADCAGLADELCAANRDVLVSFAYNASGNPNGSGNPAENLNMDIDHLAVSVDMGSVWGVAYQRETQRVFTAAFNRRHMGFGPLGTGGIYVTDVSNGTDNAVNSGYIDLNSCAGINTGDDLHTGLPADVTLPNLDQAAAYEAGKSSLGDLDISADGQYLWVTNLKDRTLHKIFIGNPLTNNVNTTPTCADIETFPIQSPCNDDLDFRPWGLGINSKGNIYVGVVCSNESGNGQFEATIYEFTEPNNWTPVLNFPLDYPKGFVSVFFGNAFNPWVTTDVPNPGGIFGSLIIYPQPILSDIEFDADGSMVLGFADRTGFQSGFLNYYFDTGDLYENFSGGDILRAQINDAGTGWVLENNATFPGVTNAPTGCGANEGNGDPGEGPGGGEFYCGDFWEGTTNQNEASLGGLAILKGSGEVMSSMYDPTREINAGGVQKFASDGSNDDNSALDDFAVYIQDDAGTFGKSAGIGDVELLCDAPPIEIGNRVFVDINGNGVQDPGEQGLSGITVNLYDRATGNIIATTVTNINGEYYFNSEDFPAIMPNTDYVIALDGSQYDESLNGLDVGGGTRYLTTIANAGINDEIDSDGLDDGTSGIMTIDLDNIPFIEVTTGLYGQNDHSFDFGFDPNRTNCDEIGISADQNPVCEPNTVTITASGDFDTYDFLNNGTSVQNTASNTYTASQGGTYTVIGTSALCEETSTELSITIYPQPTTTLSATGGGTSCDGTVTLTASTGFTSYEWFLNGNSQATTASNTYDVTTSGNWTVQVTSSDGCISEMSAPVDVQVGNKPTLSVDNDYSLCEGESQFIMVATNGTSITVTVGSGDQNSIDGTPTTSGFDVSPNTTTVYNVTVSNDECEETAQVTVTVFDSPEVTLDVTGGGPSCTGTVTLTATSGFASYEWYRNGSSVGVTNNNTFDVSQSGTYTVQVTTTDGCSTMSAETEVQVGNAPSLNVEANHTICDGEDLMIDVNTNGTSIDVTVVSGDQNSIDGTPTLTGFMVSPNTTTVYNVTVSNGECDTSQEVTVNVDDTPTPEISAGSGTSCTGSITLTATPGFASYEWFRNGGSDGTTTSNTFEANQSGDYIVEVTTADGCLGVSSSINVQVGNGPTLTVETSHDICLGDELDIDVTTNAPSIDVSVITGDQNSIVGTPTVTGFTVNPNTTTVYQVRVEREGCEVMREVTVTVNDVPEPSLTASGDGASCDGTVTLTAAAGFASYDWFRNGGFQTTTSTNTYDVTLSGNYTVEVTSPEGCAGMSAVVNVDIGNAPTLSVDAGNNEVCRDENLNIDVFTNASSIQVTIESGDQNSIVGTPNTGGFTVNPTSTTTYVVSVTIGQCTTEEEVTITVLDVPEPSLSATSEGISCTGTATLTATPAGLPSYEWFRNGASVGTTSTNTFNVTQSGMYTVEATNANDCMGLSVAIDVQVGTAPTLNVNADNDICEGESLSLDVTTNAQSIDVSVESGDQGSIDGTPSINGFTVSPTETTVYKVTVTTDGCSTMQEVTVRVNSIPEPTLTAAGSNETCEGTVTLTATDGFDTYEWFRNGASVGNTNNNTFNATQSGEYTVEVTSAEGCAGMSEALNVQVGTAPTLTVETAHTICAGEILPISVTTNAATISVTVVSGDDDSIVGTPLLNGFSVNPSITTIYEVVVSTGDCSTPETVTVTISDIDNLNLQATEGGAACDESLTLTVTDGFESYEWILNGEVVATTSSNTYEATESGEYEVTVTNEDGCTATTAPPVAISVNNRPTLSVDGEFAVCNDEPLFIPVSTNAGTITVAVASGDAGSIDGTPTASGFTVSPTETTVYDIEVSRLGCTTEGTVTVIVADIVDINIEVSPDTQICANEGTITLTATPSGLGVYKFVRNDLTTVQETTSNVFQADISGTYTVTVETDDGCMGMSDGMTIVISEEPTVDAGDDEQICEGQTATLSILTNANVINIEASPADASISCTDCENPVVQPSVNTTYTVTVRNADGCENTDEMMVMVSENPTPIISGGPFENICEENLPVTLNVNATFSSYTWFRNGTQVGTGSSLTVNQAGNYTVEVTDGEDCDGVSEPVSVTIKDTPAPQLTASDGGAFCEGGAITLTVSDGFATYTWFKDGVELTSGSANTLEIDESGLYTVTVVDEDGCVGESNQVTITENGNPMPGIEPSGEPAICEGESLDLTLIGDFASVQWQVSNNGTFEDIVGQTGNILTVSETGSYQAIVATEAGCDGVSEEVRATVKEKLPINFVGFPGEVCEDQLPVTLTATSYPNATYTFLLNGNVVQEGLTNQFEATEGGNYSISIVDEDDCISESTESALNILPLPSLSFDLEQFVCQGSTLQVEVNTNAAELEIRVESGDFSSIAGNVSTNGFAVNPTSNTVYMITVTSVDGCMIEEKVNVTVIAPQEVALTASADEICLDEAPIVLTAEEGFVRYDFYDQDNIIIQSSTSNTVNIMESGSYRVRAINEYGCEDSSAPVTVIVNPNPEPMITVTGDGTFCEGGNLLITATAGYDQYEWYRDGNLVHSSVINEFLATLGGEYNVVATDLATGCTGSSHPVELSVDPLPNPEVLAMGDLEFCPGESVLLTVVGNYTTIQWMRGGEDIPGANSTIYVASEAGVYTVFVSDGNECQGTSEGTTVVVFDAVEVTLTASDEELCRDEAPASLSATAGYANYIFYRNGFIIVQEGPENTYSVDMSGDYAVLAVSEDGCDALSNGVRIDIFDEPFVEAGVNLSICEGETATMSITSDAEIISITPNPADATLTCSDCNNPTATPSESTTYTVLVRNAFGCEATDEITINVKRIGEPVIVLPSDKICEQDLPVTLSVDGIFELYEWRNNGVIVGFGSTFDAMEAGTYTVVATKEFGCPGESESVSFEVVSTPEPTVTTEGDGTFCEGGMVTLSASAGFDGYQWYLDGQPITDANGSTYEALESGLYTVEVTDADGCSGRSTSLNISTNALPNPEVTVVGDTEVCNEECVTLIISGAYAAIDWYIGDPVEIDEATLVGSGATYEACESGRYFAFVTDGEDCSGASNSVNVEVKDEIVVDIVTLSNPVCEEDLPAELRANDYPNASYIWYLNGVIVQDNLSNTYDAEQGGIYLVEVTTEDGCQNLSAEFLLEIDESPFVDAGDARYVCEGEELAIDINSDAEITDIKVVDGDSADQISCICMNPTVSPTVNTTYEVTVTSDNGCIARTIFEVLVYPAPEYELVTPNRNLCEGDETTISVSPDTFDQYDWYDADGTLIQSGTNHVLTVTETGTYSVIVTDGDDCKGSEEVAIQFQPLPFIDIEITEQEVGCASATATLEATAGHISYQWFLNEVLISTTTTNTIQVDQEGEYSVTVLSESGCNNTSDAVLLQFGPLPEIPRPQLDATGEVSTCEGDDVQEICVIGDYASYEWYATTDENTVLARTQCFEPTEEGAYFAKVITDEACESETTSVNVVFIPTPEIVGGPVATTEGCLGETNDLQISINEQIASYEFNTTDGLSDISQNGSDLSFTVTIIGDFTYTVSITGVSGCTVEESFRVLVPDACFEGTIGDTVFFDDNGNGVQDPGEDGIAGVTVTLTLPDGSTATATTNVTGMYIFTDLQPGSYTVTVGDGPTNTTITTPGSFDVDLGAGDSFLDADFGFVPDPLEDGQIGDTVFSDTNGNGVQDPGENGIGGITVTLTLPDGSTTTTTTDSNGNYLFTGLPAGNYTVTVGNGPNDTTITTPGSFNVSLEESESFLDADFGFEPDPLEDGEIGDTVFSDDNGNGVQDPGEDGIAGITVTLILPDGSTVSTFTDSNGNYLFTGLPAGDYTVIVGNGPADSTLSTVGSFDVSLGESESFLDADFGFEPAPVNNAQIGDTVFYDDNGNGVQDPGEEGIGGITVTLTLPDGSTRTTTTDTNGNYLFGGLPAGMYTVTVGQGPNNTSLTTTGSFMVDLQESESYLDADFGFQLDAPTGQIGDTVFRDDNGNGVQDPGEPGIAGITVTLYLPDGSTRTTVTDANGNYLFGGLPAGDYRVEVGSGPNNFFLTTPGVFNISLADNESNLTADFGFLPKDLPRGAIGDYVWLDEDEDGIQDVGEIGIGGVLVTLTDANGNIQTLVTDASGFYLFTDLELGNYTVTVDVTTAPNNYALTTVGSYSVSLTEISNQFRDADFGFFDDTPPVDDCVVNAGTLMPKDGGNVCVDNSILQAFTVNAPIVPTGYELLYVLTDANLVILQVAPSASFNGLAAGNYTIHTLVYNPTTLDISIITFGVTTGLDVNNLLKQGGGEICAALLIDGAKFNVSDDHCEKDCTTTVEDICAEPMTPVRVCPDFPCLAPGFAVTEAETTFNCGLKLEQECVVYTGLPAFAGSDQIVIIACDAVRCDTAYVNIFVTEDCSDLKPNNPPVAGNDSGTSTNGSVVTINLLANDSDPDGDPIYVSTVNQPANGTVTLANGIILYTPNDGFVGTDVFTYELCDGKDCVTGTITIDVLQSCNPTTYLCAEPVTPIQICPEFCTLGNGERYISSAHTTYNCSLKELNNGCIQYTALPLFAGKETIVITGCNMNGQCETVEIVVDVTADCGYDTAIDDVNKTEDTFEVSLTDTFRVTDLQPVPAEEYINVSFTTTAQPISLELYDLTGKLILSQDVAAKAGLNMVRVDLDNLPTGIYVMSVVSGGEAINTKFVKR